MHLRLLSCRPLWTLLLFSLVVFHLCDEVSATLDGVECDVLGTDSNLSQASPASLLDMWASAAASAVLCSSNGASQHYPPGGLNVCGSGIHRWIGSSVGHPVFKISLLDVWAGVSSFAEGFARQAYVIVNDHAWIESAPAAVSVLNEFYKTAQSCTDFYNRAWEAWSFNHRLVVVSGRSCCPFSVSGKR
jgi:hypothetical protein